MKVKIKKLNDKAVMPTKAHATDAGFDLYCTSKEVNWGTRLLTCHTGLAFEIPVGYASMVIYGIWTLWRMENSQLEEMSLAHFVTLRNGLTGWSVQFSRPRLMHLNGEIRPQTDGIVD